MVHVVEYDVEGGSVFVEVSSSGLEGELVRAGADAGFYLEKAASTFDHALRSVMAATNAFIRSTEQLTVKPAEFTVNFGLTLSGDVKALIVTCGTAANFNISMKWLAEGSGNGAETSPERRGEPVPG